MTGNIAPDNYYIEYRRANTSYDISYTPVAGIVRDSTVTATIDITKPGQQYEYRISTFVEAFDKEYTERSSSVVVDTTSCQSKL